MSDGDLMAAFWRPLKQRVDAQGLRAKLRRELALSESAVSELLNGKRAKAPDWEVVRAVVIACSEPVEVGGQLRYWRQRLGELERELALRGATFPPHLPAPPEAPGCPLCADATSTSTSTGDLAGYRQDEWDDADPSPVLAAVRLLSGQRADLRAEFELIAEIAPESPGDLAVFRERFLSLGRALLSGLDTTVRKSCRTHRLLLLDAAHTVLLAEGTVMSAGLDLRFDDLRPVVWPLLTGHNILENSRTGPLPEGDLPFAELLRAQAADYDVTERAGYGYGYRESTDEGESEGEGEDQELDLWTPAVSHYASRLLELAAECPEMFAWAGMQEGDGAALAAHGLIGDAARDRLTALRHGLRSRNRGLEGLEGFLRPLSGADRRPSVWPERLSKIHRAALTRPISAAGETGGHQPGPRIPDLAAGYVNPAFRTAVFGDGSLPHQDTWWHGQPLREEIQGFLAAHLTGAAAGRRLLLILGDPGAGKSLLTRLLAARLPAADYLPVRVELRNVQADTHVLDQIAQALRLATHENVSWEDVTGAADDVLPVLIFDGFDELLQAGGADHWRYLEQLAAFQRTSADNGLPVAVIVTSRTVVADQAGIPASSAIIRLEPFDSDRIARWTDVWNTTNSGYHRGSGIAPLEHDMGPVHAELAAQPLLLLLLALYYSTEKDAARAAAVLNRGDLYERLLRLFVRRQITKLEPGLRPDALEQRIEDELDLLSVIAVAMFNRGRQGVSAAEADRDLRHLRAPDSGGTSPASQMLFGRFFFVHEAKATFGDGAERRWYEFLHATFGEYLVARKIARTLAHRPDQGGPYEALLFALLSFTPLTDRARIIEDLRATLPPAAVETVSALFPTALDERPPGGTAYTAGPVTITYRHACYSANLLMLALAAGGPVDFAAFGGGTDYPLERWSAHAALWKSQFGASAWDAFTRAVSVEPYFGAGATGRRYRGVTVRLGGSDASARGLDWLLPLRKSTDRPKIFLFSSEDALRRSRVLLDQDTELTLDPGLPLFEQLPTLTGFYLRDAAGRYVSVAGTLVTLLSCPPAPISDPRPLYRICLDALEYPFVEPESAVLTGLLARRLAGESADLPTDFVNETLTTLVAEWPAAFETEDPTVLDLLLAAYRHHARSRDPDMIEIMAMLLGTRMRQQHADMTGEVLLHALSGALDWELPADRGPGRIRLLRLAVALDQRTWCEHYAARFLDPENPADLGRLLPSEVEYLLHSAAWRGLAERPETGTTGGHP